MKINIVMGFFLPVPPAAGGATEKSWHRLAQEFARRGHEVTLISRTWPGWSDDERSGGVRYLRLPGFDHTARLLINLWRDFRWSRRVSRALPPADVTVINCIALPIWIGARRPSSGRIAVMTGRMPKGQYRLYGRIDRVLAVSTIVRDAILAEKPALTHRLGIYGYPIDWKTMANRGHTAANPEITIGFVGRLNREKGLDLLVTALELLAKRTDLPRWRVLWCGPKSVAQGGSGESYVQSLEARLALVLPADRVEILSPVFDPAQLALMYQKMDIFCYPSLAERGETFGVAVAEAMAAGVVPVVSALGCFRDFLIAGQTGEIFDHTAPNAAEQLTAHLAALITDSNRRRRMATAAQNAVKAYDFSAYADRLLADFSALN